MEDQAAEERAERERSVARWLDLTRRVLPNMAAANGWPIRYDHCFMRVCLDAACGQPWPEVIARPAIRHASLDVLRAAIAIAERVADQPALLASLNRDSLAGRKKI